MERRGEILNQLQAFPSIPATAGKLLKMLEDPETTAAQVESVLKLDPGLTANILRLTNSAYFGLPQQVGSIRQAVVLLGWKRLTSLILTTCMNAVLNKPVDGYELGDGDMWRHALAVSVAAEGLSKILGLKNVDEVFTAALLHDLCKMVLGRYVAEDIQKIVSKHFNIKFADLKGKKKNNSIVLPRQIAMYLIRKKTSLSLPEIGHYFGGKDHSTVIYSIKKIEGLLQEDKKVKNIVETLLKKM